MRGNFKTEAVVLRSIRYGEADRIVHLYSATRGRIGAIAKGSRRPQGRFRGRAPAVLPVEPGPLRGAGRPVHGDRGLHGRGPWDAAVERAGSRVGGAGLRRGAAAARLGRGETSRPQTSPPF